MTPLTPATPFTPDHPGSERHARVPAKLGALAARKPWYFIGAWLIVLLVVVGLNSQFGGTFANDYTVPGSQSSTGLDVLTKNFPEKGGYAGSIVFHSRSPNSPRPSPRRETPRGS